MVNDQINDFQKGLLDGVRVVEFGGKVSAPYCGLNLSGLGAEVIKVEPLSGDVSRKIGPFPSENIDTEKSALYLALNRGNGGDHSPAFFEVWKGMIYTVQST